MRGPDRRAFLGGTLAMPLAAQAEAKPRRRAGTRRYVLPFASVIPLRSAVNGVAYELYVRVPATYDRGRRYSTVWTLDADYSFAIAANHLEHLADRQHIPEQILVSVAYAGVYPDRSRYQMERSRDYTPVYWPNVGYGPEYQAHSGGAPAFLRMLAEEAIPLIDRTFATDPAQRTLCGHSYGGLFAGWVLQERPALFDRYLLVSPSLWYADKLLLGRETRREFEPLPRATRVWMGVGWWEEEATGGMVTDLKRFAELLAARGDPKLTVEHKVFGDESHASIFPAAFSTGMRHLYPVDWLAAAKTPAQRGDGCVSP